MVTETPTETRTLLVGDWSSWCSECGRGAATGQRSHITVMPGGASVGCGVPYDQVALAADANGMTAPGAWRIADSLGLPYGGRAAWSCGPRSGPLGHRQADSRYSGGEWDPPRETTPEPATEGTGRPWRGARFSDEPASTAAAASPAAGNEPPGGAEPATDATAPPGIHSPTPREGAGGTPARPAAHSTMAAGRATTTPPAVSTRAAQDARRGGEVRAVQPPPAAAELAGARGRHDRGPLTLPTTQRRPGRRTAVGRPGRPTSSRGARVSGLARALRVNPINP